MKDVILCYGLSVPDLDKILAEAEQHRKNKSMNLFIVSLPIGTAIEYYSNGDVHTGVEALVKLLDKKRRLE